MDKPVILFDGVCNLCTWSVQFVIRRDPKAQFRFAAMQSPAGQRLLAQHGLDQLANNSFVLIEGAGCYTRSDAALRVTGHLEGVWPLLRALAIIPRPMRDWAYAVVARNRHRWFGQPAACMVPTPTLRDRFL